MASGSALGPRPGVVGLNVVDPAPGIVTVVDCPAPPMPPSIDIMPPSGSWPEFWKTSLTIRATCVALEYLSWYVLI